jgi:hypothetical protein
MLSDNSHRAIAGPPQEIITVLFTLRVLQW